jgi:hypothetical protein
MAIYMRLQKYFKAGTFYGLEESVHIHVHPTEPSAVINCFNLTDKPTEKVVEFFPARVGLNANRTFKIIGPASQPVDGGYRLTFQIPAHGHSLAEMTGD